MTLSYSQVELSALVRAIAAQFQVIADRVGIYTHASVEEGLSITADREQLQRVLLSLWSTLVRYTPPSGTVSVTLEKQNPTVLLRLTTSQAAGDGLSAAVPRRPLDHLEGLLEGGPSKLDTALNHVTDIIASHHGRFEAVGGKDGTWTFDIHLPLLLGAQSLSETSGTRETASLDPPEGAAPQVRLDPVSREEEGRSPGAPPHVLVLISNPDLNAFAAQALSFQCTVTQVFDKDSASRQIETRRPDLIITETPYRSIAVAFKDGPLQSGIPLMTLIASGEDALEADLDAPVIETFLRMPFTQHILHSRADRLIRQYRSTNRRLRESEARYRALFQSSPEAIVVSKNEEIILVNQAALALFNAQKDSQLVGQSIYAMVDPQCHGALRQRVEHAVLAHEPLPLFEHRILRLDGQLVDVEALSVPVDLGGEVTIHSLLRDVSERRTLERQVIDVATAEQIRIGAEIHDGIGQELTALDLLSYGLERQVRNQAPHELLTVRLEELRGHVQRALNTTRMLAKGLSPAQIGPDGLPGELARLASNVMAASGITCIFNATGVPQGLDEATAVHLYRIAQEAVNNAVKHAKAEKIDIRLEINPGETRLSVIDNGVGITSSGIRERGIGLKIMRYRANLIGANLNITSDDTGTRVECSLACPA